MWDNNKRSVIWVFRVLEEDEGLLPKKKKKKSEGKIAKYFLHIARVKSVDLRTGETQQKSHPNTL